MIYEGHDKINRKDSGIDPKTIDQPMYKRNKELTQNGLFYYAAKNIDNGLPPEKVKVYEKIRDNVWYFKGVFDLIDSWIET